MDHLRQQMFRQLGQRLNQAWKTCILCEELIARQITIESASEFPTGYNFIHPVKENL